MKKLFLFLSFILASLIVNSQSLTKPFLITSSKVTNYIIPLSDSIVKNASKTYYFNTLTAFTDVKVQCLTSRARVYATNKPKVRIYQYSSLDNLNWVFLDSATTINGTATYGITAKVVPYANFHKVVVKGIDSTQTTQVILNVLTVKTQ